MVTPSWAASPTFLRAKLKSVPASKPARSCWDTSSVAARRARSTACWRRVMGWARSTWCIAANLAAWRRYASNKIVSIPLKEAISKNRVVDNEMIQIVDGLFEELGVKETASK